MTSYMAQQAELARRIAQLKEQMLIVLLKRLADENGEFEIPISEVDDTHQDLLEFQAHPERQVFVFKLSKKS